MGVKPQNGDTSKRVFPTFIPNAYGGEGLTKRELFAAMAMQGLTAHASLEYTPVLVARDALATADELIKALEASDAGPQEGA